MSRKAATWLPIGIVMRDDVRFVVGAAVEQWSKVWFSRVRLRLGVVKPVAPGMRGYGDEGGWRAPGSAVAINSSPRATARLADWALDAGLEASRAGPTATDSRLLALFESRLIDDLALRVDRALGIVRGSDNAAPAGDDPLRGRGGGLFPICDESGSRLFWMAAPFEPLADLCRRSLAPRSARATPLIARRAALASQTVTIEASLGEVELTLNELQNLAPGDVLVLNRGLSDPIDIRRSGQNTVVARARMIQDEGHLALALEPQIR